MIEYFTSGHSFNTVTDLFMKCHLELHIDIALAYIALQLAAWRSG